MWKLTEEDCGCEGLPCCDPLHVPIYHDCIEAGINQFFDVKFDQYTAHILSGLKYGEDDSDDLLRMQEMQLISDHLLYAFDQRVRDTFETGTDLGQAYYWDKFRIDCLVAYVHRVFRMDGKDLALIAGFYEPEHPMPCTLDQLPVPYEIPCGEPAPFPPPPPPIDPSDPCGVEAAFEAVLALDASDYQADPPDSVYIISNDQSVNNEWALHVGEILDTVYIEVPQNAIVHTTSPDQLWVQTVQGPQMYFPPLNAFVDGTTVTVSSPYPGANAILPWLITVELEVDGTWVTVYGPDVQAIFVTDQDYTVIGEVTNIRTSYTIGSCMNGPYIGVTTLPPLDCGMLTVTAVPVSDHETGTFTVEVTAGVPDDYLVGHLRITGTSLDLTQPMIAPGLTVVGPFNAFETVYLEVVSSAGSICNMDLGSFSEGACYGPEELALLVDASEMDTALPDTLYFILSDSSGSANLWADNVGSTVLNGLFTPVPVGGEIRIGNPLSNRVIWSGSTILPFAPQINGTYTQDTFTFISQHPQVHSLKSRSVKVEAYSSLNDWFLLYEGPESALSNAQSIPYNSNLSLVSMIRATYTWGGCSSIVSGDDISGSLVDCENLAPSIPPVLEVEGTLLYQVDVTLVNDISDTNVYDHVVIDAEVGGIWSVIYNGPNIFSGTPTPVVVDDALAITGVRYSVTAGECTYGRFAGSYTPPFDGIISALLISYATDPLQRFRSSVASPATHILAHPTLGGSDQVHPAGVSPVLDFDFDPGTGRWLMRSSDVSGTPSSTLLNPVITKAKDLIMLRLSGVTRLEVNGLTDTVTLPDLENAGSLLSLFLNGAPLMSAFGDTSGATALINLFLTNLYSMEDRSHIETIPSLKVMSLTGLWKMKDLPRPDLFPAMETIVWNLHLAVYLSNNTRVLPPFTSTLKSLTVTLYHLVDQMPDMSPAINLEVLSLNKMLGLIQYPSLASNTKLLTLILNGSDIPTSFPDTTTNVLLKTLNLAGGIGLITTPNIDTLVNLEALTYGVVPNTTSMLSLTYNVKLKQINFYTGHLTDIPLPSLSTLVALESIKVAYCAISALPSMANCTVLNTVEISSSGLVNWSGLEDAPWVKKILINSTPTVPDLTAFDDLEELTVSGTITALPSMSAVASVKFLFQGITLNSVGTLPKIKGLSVPTNSSFTTTVAVANALFDALDETLPTGVAHFGKDMANSEYSKIDFSDPVRAAKLANMTSGGNTWSIW